MVFVRVVRGRFDPARYDELVALAQDVTAVVLALPGCQSYLGAADRAAGKTINVTTWDTEGHARLSRDEAMPSLMPRYQAIGLQVDPPEIYESSRGTVEPAASSR